jgi:hypothetical protein
MHFNDFTYSGEKSEAQKAIEGGNNQMADYDQEDIKIEID